MFSQVRVDEIGVCLATRKKDDLHSALRERDRDLLPGVLLDAHVVVTKLELTVDVVGVDLHRDTEELHLELRFQVGELLRDGANGCRL